MPSTDKEPRKSLTKRQLQTAAGVELLSLCQSVTDDGKLLEAEIEGLRQWLVANKTSEMRAVSYLDEVIEKVLSDGKITDDEFEEIYLAIETILPPEIRKVARTKRRELSEAKRVEEIAQLSHERPVEDADFMVAGVRYEGRAEIISEYVNEGDEIVLGSGLID
jgi:argininosuccinate lyase